MGTRDELLKAVACRYRSAPRAEKGRILTEFAEISGYHHKHADDRCGAGMSWTGPDPGPSAACMTMPCARHWSSVSVVPGARGFSLTG